MDEDSVSKKRRLARERKQRWRARQSQAILDRLQRERAEKEERRELRKNIADSLASDQSSCPKNQRRKMPFHAYIHSPTSFKWKSILIPSLHEDKNGRNANQIGENIKSLEILKNVKVESEEESDENKTTTCDFCNKQCQYPSNLERHMKAVHPMLFNCSFCEQTFASDWDRRKHKWCYKDTILCCHVCNRTFPSNCHLIAHVQNIHGIGQTKGVHHCGECGKCFSEKIRLANHTKMAHANELLTLSCDFCDEEFYVDRDLVQHVRSVHENRDDSMDIKPAISELNEEDHFCDHCGSRFTIETHLKEHLHNGTCSSRDFHVDGQDEEISDHEATLVTYSIEPT